MTGWGASLVSKYRHPAGSLGRVGGGQPHQCLWLEILDDGILSDGQVVLVPTEEKAVVDRVAHQVDAGSHDEGDDTDVDYRPRQRAGGPLDELGFRMRSTACPPTP